MIDGDIGTGCRVAVAVAAAVAAAVPLTVMVRGFCPAPVLLK
jgi:hypothetical protein